MNDFSKNSEAYFAIKDLISAKKLSPGQKVIYRDLENKLNMSKTPIINALMKLEQENLVVSKRNCGFYIRDILSGDTEQIFQLREKLEELSLHFAIRNFRGEDLSILAEKLANYLNYSSKIYDRKRANLDIDFHTQIAIMGKNKFFVSLIRQFYEQIYFNIDFSFLTPYIGQFKTEHRLLFAAIKKKSMKEARKIIRSHSRMGRNAFQKID
jgi:DNA-binding GntR family transcriptional regulator